MDFERPIRMRLNTSHRLLLCVITAAISGLVQASHLLAAEIDLYFISGNQYEVRLLLWRDCAGVPPGGSEAIDYSSPCGSGTLILPMVPGATTDVSPLCDVDMMGSSCNGGALPGIERVEYATTVTLAPCDAWLFQYVTCCMAAANNLGTVSVELVAHTTLNNLDMACRGTPRFAHPGLPYRSSNSPFTLDLLGVVDGPGTAQYALVNLLTSGGMNAPYAPGYTGMDPYPGLAISSTTGVMTTSSTSSFGYWVLVPELRHYDGGTLMASVERVLAMPTSSLTDQPPLATDGALTYVSGSGTVTGARTIDVPVGGTICASMSYADPNSIDSVFISTDLTSALTGASVTLTDGNPGTSEFCWTVPPGSSGMYHFMVLASDERCPVDQDQYFLYSVHIVPDVTNPCIPTEVAAHPPAPVELLSAFVGPAGGWLTWEMPSGTTASRIALYDAHGRALVDDAIAPASRGRMDLSPALRNGAYVLVCGDLRTRLIVAR